MTSRRHTIALIAFMAMGGVVGGAAGAAPAASSMVVAESCWIRGMPVQVPSAGYFVLKNQGTAGVRLTGLSSDAYGHAMLHQTITEGGMSRMSMAHELDVPAGSTLSFAPGSYHAMLEAPARTLAAGDTVELRLTFDDGSTVAMPCRVRPASALGIDR